MFSGIVATPLDVRTEEVVRQYRYFWAHNWRNGRCWCIYCHKAPSDRFSFALLSYATGAKHHLDAKGHYRLLNAMACVMTRKGPKVGTPDPDKRKLNDEGAWSYLFRLVLY